MYVCAKITVKGVVQGVGFRYFAFREARALGLAGYAKNRFNGDVETEVEGLLSSIEDYIKSLRVGPSFSHVTDIQVDWKKYEKKYDDFTITG